MKTITIKKAILALTIFTSVNTLAQKLYVDVNIGYAMAIGGGIDLQSASTTSYNNQQTNERTQTTTYSSVNSSLGKGFNFGGSIGYLLNKNIGFELGLNYLLGAPVESEKKTYNTSVNSLGETTIRSSNFTYKTYSNMFQIVPTIVLSPGFKKINPYTKISFLMGFGTIFSEDEFRSNNFSSDFYNTEYSGGLGIGFSGSFGGAYTLNDKVSVFSEVRFMSFSYAPKKSVTTKYTRNGVDQLPLMTTWYKEVAYLEEYTLNGTINYDEPRKKSKEYYSYNNIGLNFGVKYSF